MSEREKEPPKWLPCSNFLGCTLGSSGPHSRPFISRIYSILLTKSVPANTNVTWLSRPTLKCDRKIDRETGRWICRQTAEDIFLYQPAYVLVWKETHNLMKPRDKSKVSDRVTTNHFKYQCSYLKHDYCGEKCFNTVGPL